jgi:hypothetical protein
MVAVAKDQQTKAGNSVQVVKEQLLDQFVK